MGRSYGGAARRGVARLAASCLAGTAIVGGTILGQASPAFASCSSAHQGVVGVDNGNYTAFGNKGDIYVNTSTVINNLHGAIARSFFIIMPAGYDVEVGWAANEMATRGL